MIPMSFYNVKASFFCEHIDAGNPVELEINPQVYIAATRLPDALHTDELVRFTFNGRQKLKVDEFCIRGPLMYKGFAREICVPWAIVYAMTDGIQHCVDWSIIPKTHLAEFTAAQCRQAYCDQVSATWYGDVAIGRGFNLTPPGTTAPKLQALEGGNAPVFRNAWAARERRSKLRIVRGGKNA